MLTRPSPIQEVVSHTLGAPRGCLRPRAGIGGHRAAKGQGREPVKVWKSHGVGRRVLYWKDRWDSMGVQDSGDTWDLPLSVLQNSHGLQGACFHGCSPVWFIPLWSLAVTSRLWQQGCCAAFWEWDLNNWQLRLPVVVGRPVEQVRLASRKPRCYGDRDAQ